MSYEWTTKHVSMPFSPDLSRADNPVAEAMRAEIAWLEEEFSESLLDRFGSDGPRLGPNRNDYERIMAPVWRKQRLVDRIRSVMPGKRPGRFLREWECTAEDHPAPFFCRECGAHSCCCRCP